MTDTTITQDVEFFERNLRIEEDFTRNLREIIAKLEALMNARMSKILTKDSNGNKVSAVAMTEARRLAKEVVKNEIRAAGMKISHVEASVITKAANELMTSEQGADFIAQAVELIEQRKAVKSNLDIASLVHVSPELVAKAEKAKAERKKRG